MRQIGLPASLQGELHPAGQTDAGAADFAEITHTTIRRGADDTAIGVIKMSSRAEDGDENAAPSGLLCDEDFAEILAYA